MIVKENGMIYNVETIENQEVRKRVKIYNAYVAGGGQCDSIDWFNSPVRLKHSMRLDVLGAPSELCNASAGTLTFEDLINMAGGNMDQFALAWADKVDSTMNQVIEVV